MKQLSSGIIDHGPALPIKVLQFGGGNFLRAFADWMIQELNDVAQFNGGVAIIKPTERGAYKDLSDQDGLYNVILRGMHEGQYQESITCIKCVQEVIHPYHHWEDFLSLAEDSNIRFVISNTTESGIKFNPADRLDNGANCEYPGKLVQWLHHRYSYFKGDSDKACIMLPMELIEQNGQQLRSCLLDYAHHWHLGQDFINWIDHNIFCNTLVDRIISGYPQNDVADIEERLGYRDQLLVVGEQYHSWIIQAPQDISDELPFGKTKLNVQFTDDLDIHRKIKVRFLNGAHTSLVPIGYMSGYTTVKDAIEDSDIRSFIKQELTEEVLPTIDHPMPQLEKYIQGVIERFDNPSLEHLLLDISLNSISKYRVRLLPSLLDYYKKHSRIPHRIAFALAALIRLYKGTFDNTIIELRDNPDHLHFYKNCWEQDGDNLKVLVGRILQNETLWAQDLTQISGLHDTVTTYLRLISDQLNATGKLKLKEIFSTNSIN